MKKSIALAITVSCIALFTGCGGGGSSNSTTPAVATNTGTFVDSPVMGLDYNCSSGQHGISDTNGSFTYENNDTCDFHLGTLHLGTAKLSGTNAKITPSDIADGNNTISGNIASLLQSLDDHNTSGKINIPSGIKSKVELLGLNIKNDSTSFYNALDGNKSTLGLSSVIDSANATVAMNNYLASSLSNTILTGKVLNGVDASRITFYSNGIYFAEYLNLSGNPTGVTGAGTWSSKDGKTVNFINSISHKTTVATLTSSTSATVVAPDNTSYTVDFTQAPIVKIAWDGTSSSINGKTLSISSVGIDAARIMFASSGNGFTMATLSGTVTTGTWSVGLNRTMTLSFTGGLSIIATLNADETCNIITNGQSFPGVYILQ